jgi:hypothetical protein
MQRDPLADWIESFVIVFLGLVAFLFMLWYTSDNWINHDPNAIIMRKLD